MSNLTVEIERAKSNGDYEVAGFSGSIRSLENLAFEEGDVITIPANPKVFETKIGTNKAQYIFVECTGKSGETSIKRFFPSTMTKSRSIVNEDGTPTGTRAFTKGTAAELYRSEGSVAKGMKLLEGKKLVFTTIETVKCLRFNSDQVINTTIPTIDLVEAAA